MCHSPDEAWQRVEQFYSNYRSMRFFGELLVLRLNRPVSDTILASLNDQFGLLCSAGEFERAAARPEEISEGDDPDAPRVAFRFARRHYGHLRMLINHLNQHG